MKDFTKVRRGCAAGRTRPGSSRRFAGVAIAAAALLAPACGNDRDIEKPTPLFSESTVEYPLELWDRDVEGNTLVRVLVSESGGVDSVVVEEGSGHALLDSAAVRGALAMEFEPAMREGEPVRAWARVPVHFSKAERPAGTARPQVPENGNSARPAEGDPRVPSGLRG